MESFKLNTIEEAVADFAEGKFVIVVDDEDRENEGDLVIAAEKITPEQVNFMLKNARGVLCAPITIERCKELDLPHQGAAPPAFLPTTVPRPSRHWPIPPPVLRPSDVRDMSTPSMPRRTVYCVAAATPKPPLTSVVWQVYTLPVP